MNQYDVIVVGVGGVGSAALYEMAKRGMRVLGIEQDQVPNDRGSSHGESRILRLAYFEHGGYVALAQAALRLWHDLQEDSSEEVFVKTGSLDAGLPKSDLFQGALKSCVEHNLEHRLLNSREVRVAFPGYRLPAGFMAVYQPDGGVLLAEKCVTLFVRRAMKYGALLHTDERVISVKSLGSGFVVNSMQSTYKAQRLVITAGAWLPKLLPEFGSIVTIERQVMGWFRPLSERKFAPDKFPVCNIAHLGEHLYAIPCVSQRGFKCGISHHLREQIDPDCDSRICTDRDEDVIRSALQELFPEGMGEKLALKTCLYTNTKDRHFVVGSLPSDPAMFVAGGFSGHGFKFACLVGRILAELVETGRCRYDLSLFSLNRFDGSNYISGRDEAAECH